MILAHLRSEVVGKGKHESRSRTVVVDSSGDSVWPKPAR
jgi:hypothetical protein